MKIKIINPKKIILIFSVLLVMFSVNINKSYATPDDIPFLSGILGVDQAQKIQDATNNIKQYLATAKTVYNTYQTANAAVKNIKNFDLSTLAQNVASDQILNYSNTILAVAKGDQGIGINVNTAGNQVVTNLQNYLDKIGVNEIKKMVNDLKDPVNTTPYSSEIKDAISNFVQQTSNIATGKITNFTLPYIAKSEICNSPTLKNVIKNGEPADYVKPRPAVGNVDIDAICNTDLTDPKEGAKAQATLVGLAKAGYAGDKTSIALADPANTPSGVVDNALALLKEKKTKAEEITSKQVEATGLNIGQQICFGKDGKQVNYDPTSTSSADKFCYRQDSSVEQSGTVLKDRTAAALLGPYFSMLSRAQAINNKIGDCVPSSNTKDLNSLSGLQNSNSSGGFLSGITKCVSAASNIMSTISSVVNIGSNNYQKTLSGEDNPYSRLADQLSGIAETQIAQGDLYNNSDKATKDYLLGKQENEYTVDDLKQRIDLYKELRDFNTSRLNEHVYTYTILRTALMSGDSGLNTANNDSTLATLNAFRFGPIGWIFLGGRARTQATTSKNIAKAMNELRKALVNESIATRALIKEMAMNNYKEQQMKKLLDQFQNTNSNPEDNLQALKTALDGTITQNQFAILQEDWQYVPRYVDTDTDPTTPSYVGDMNKGEEIREKARQSAKMIPPKDEVQGPYTEQNIYYLRVRAYKLFKLNYTGTGAFMPNNQINSENIDLLKSYGISAIEDLSPDLPRASRAKSVLNSATTKDFSELAYCNYLGLSKSLCDTKALTSLIGSINSSTIDYSLIPSDADLDKYCINPEESIKNDCSNQTQGSDLYNACQNSTTLSELISKAKEFCQN